MEFLGKKLAGARTGSYYHIVHGDRPVAML